MRVVGFKGKQENRNPGQEPAEKIDIRQTLAEILLEVLEAQAILSRWLRTLHFKGKRKKRNPGPRGWHNKFPQNLCK